MRLQAPYNRNNLDRVASPLAHAVQERIRNASDAWRVTESRASALLSRPADVRSTARAIPVPPGEILGTRAEPPQMAQGDSPFKQDLGGPKGTNSCTHLSVWRGQDFG